MCGVRRPNATAGRTNKRTGQRDVVLARAADGFGLSVGDEGARLVVQNVEAGLPADLAGIRAGDEIVAVNNRSALLRDGTVCSTLGQELLSACSLRAGRVLALADDGLMPCRCRADAALARC